MPHETPLLPLVYLFSSHGELDSENRQFYVCAPSFTPNQYFKYLVQARQTAGTPRRCQRRSSSPERRGTWGLPEALAACRNVGTPPPYRRRRRSSSLEHHDTTGGARSSPPPHAPLVQCLARRTVWRRPERARVARRLHHVVVGGPIRVWSYHAQRCADSSSSC
jgi:hypothetical protein